MHKQKVGISIENNYKRSIEEVLQIVKNTGFDAISPVWKSEPELAKIVKLAQELGLELQSIHAPFDKAANMWSREESCCGPAKKELLTVIDACVKFHIPIVVVHVWIGFDYDFDEKSLNYSNYEEIVGYAEKCNIKIAFENTEGLEYLLSLMARFGNNDTVGFCWDSGHEICYNHSIDLLGCLGDQLIMTHLNDNLGISRSNGEIWWTDDLHLLPFDGIADWDYNIRRLKQAKTMPILNFEIKIESKPNRHENDKYAQMSLTQYFAEVYKRASEIAYKYSR